MLSDRDICRAVDQGQITLDPFRRDCLQPASIDVHLAKKIRWFMPSGVIDTAKVAPGHSEPWQIGSDGYHLAPGDFILGSTVEVIGCGPLIAARIEGRSSLGRIGLAVHVTAGFIDPGFTGTVTLEIANLGRKPIVLHEGMSIAQVCFLRMSSAPTETYDQIGNYTDQGSGPVESRYRLTK